MGSGRVVTRVTQILCAAEPRCSGDAIERLPGGGARSDQRCHRRDRRPQRWQRWDRRLPDRGPPALRKRPAELLDSRPADAPVADYRREAHNIEAVFPQLHGGYGTAAFTSDRHVLIAGLGAEIADDPSEEREEQQRLRCPRWELEYALKLVQELPGHELVLMIDAASPHGRAHARKRGVAELVATHRPRLVLTGGSAVPGCWVGACCSLPGACRKGCAHLRSPDFFDVERHPEMRFESTGIRRVEGGTYAVTGDTTIKDQARGVEVGAVAEGPAEDPLGKGARRHLDPRWDRPHRFRIHLQQTLAAGGLLVGEEVRILIDVSALPA
jgi:Metallophosphoesterase, calcineurin superfamily/YceI-like domain